MPAPLPGTKEVETNTTEDNLTQGDNMVTRKAARLILEVAAASAASFVISPLVAMIDQAITSQASGREKILPSLLNSFKFMCTSPVRFLRSPSVLIMMGVYTGTYSVANIVDASFERNGYNQNGSAKAVAVSAANITLINLKDVAYARLFGQGPSRPFPRLSMGLFVLRDATTVSATFSPLPGIVSKQFLRPLGVSSPDTVAMLITPMSVQILSAPLHLVGLDLYNRSDTTWKDRLAFIRREFVPTALFRMARALPAFGMGGVINKHLRSRGKDLLGAQSAQSQVRQIKVANT